MIFFVNKKIVLSINKENLHIFIVVLSLQLTKIIRTKVIILSKIFATKVSDNPFFSSSY